MLVCVCVIDRHCVFCQLFFSLSFIINLDHHLHLQYHMYAAGELSAQAGQLRAFVSAICGATKRCRSNGAITVFRYGERIHQMYIPPPVKCVENIVRLQ